MLTTDYVTGAPNWLDLGSPDTNAAASFYRAVFGWDFRSAGPEAGGYGFFQQDGKTVAALGPLTEGASPAWSIYFLAPDADATAKSVEQAGGTVRVQPFDVMTAGRMACLTDPGGAEFNIWQPGGTRGLDQVNARHTLFWVELHTADPATAHDFYHSLFGWRAQRMEAPGMTYRVISTADGEQQETAFGGIAPTMGGDTPTRWVPYFLVEDPDAAAAIAAQHGGSVLMPAADVPDVGRIAWLADPFGAPFAIMKPNPRTGS